MCATSSGKRHFMPPVFYRRYSTVYRKNRYGSILRFSRDTLMDYRAAITREWIITNGLGGYSSSTILGINTRKYHGLLLVPMNPPWERRLLLSKLEEEIVMSGKGFQLSANEYPGTIHPKGFEFLEQFRLDPLPTFSYLLPDFIVEKTLFMPHGMNGLVVNYKVQNRSGKKASFIVHPLVNSRGIHEVTKRDRIGWGFDQRPSDKKTEIVATYPGAPGLLLGSDKMIYVESGLPERARWYVNMLYRVEAERGYEASEDHYNPGFFEQELGDGAVEFNILATGGFKAEESFKRLYSENPTKFEEERQKVLDRLDGLVKKHAAFDRQEDWQRHMILAADSFISNEKAVIAGYHWFSTWGRDSLIGLPGLALVAGRFDLAKKIILTLIERRSGGMIPNKFGPGWVEYRGADAPLLLFYAIYKYLTYTDDSKFADELWPILEDILRNHLEGANEGVRIGKDGLVWCEAGMTWMDVKLGGRWVTPREGKPVEINALWYNALRIAGKIARRTGRKFEHEGLAEKVKEKFASEFWNPTKGCLYDVVNGDFHDPWIRPNQIFAVSSPFQLLDEQKARCVVSVVRENLLTPFGLRSLERGAPEYVGRCAGNVEERDRAYHQGTVWSWLIGPFITAFIRVKREPSARMRAIDFIRSLIGGHLMEAGIGTISEIFDGDEPHAARGCVSQAWSVAEVLRCYVEDIRGQRPPFEEKYG